MARHLGRIAVLACVHAVVAVGLMLYASYGSAARFEGMEAPPGATVADSAAHVLSIPGALLWTSWASRNLPNAVEWLLFVGNSVVWGAVLWTVLGTTFRARRGSNHG